MAAAPMSRIFQGGSERGEYKCHECAQRSGTPDSDSEPLRVLLLCCLIAWKDGQDLLLLAKALRANARARAAG